MPKKIACMAPRRRGDSTYLYLIGRRDGGIKIGKSVDIRHRLMTHRQHLGADLLWVHVFAGENSGNCEYAAKHALAEIGQRLRKTEVYFGLTKRQAIEACRPLVAQASYSSEQRAHQARAEARRKALEQEAWRAFRAQYVEAEA